MAELIQRTDSLNTGRVKLNEAIKASVRAEDKSDYAVQTADTAKSTADTTREEMLEIIREQTSGADVVPEVVQARGGKETLGERLNSIDQDLAQKSDRNEVMSQVDFDSWVATILDGGPSIFMETLSALETAYPNGSSGVALVRETDPARIYVWNGTAWQDFGEYQGAIPKDHTVSPIKTTFIDLSTNLFDKNDVITGYTIDSSTGNLISNSDFSTSKFREVDPMTNYTFKKLLGWEARVAFYDHNRALLRTFPLGSQTDERTSMSPAGARFLRVAVRNENLNVFQVNKGNAALPYEEHYRRLDRNIEIPLNGNDISIEYSNGVPQKVVEKRGDKIIKETELTFDSNGSLLSVIDSANGEEIETTLTYDGDVLTAVNRETL